MPRVRVVLRREVRKEDHESSVAAESLRGCLEEALHELRRPVDRRVDRRRGVAHQPRWVEYDQVGRPTETREEIAVFEADATAESGSFEVLANARDRVRVRIGGMNGRRAGATERSEPHNPYPRQPWTPYFRRTT